MAAQRTPEEIRASIEENRMELARSLETLRSELKAATDWRSYLVRYRREVLTGAATTGFVLGGGIAAIGGLFRSG